MGAAPTFAGWEEWIGDPLGALARPLLGRGAQRGGGSLAESCGVPAVPAPLLGRRVGVRNMGGRNSWHMPTCQLQQVFGMQLWPSASLGSLHQAGTRFWDPQDSEMTLPLSLPVPHVHP